MPLLPGDPAPLFVGPTSSNDRFVFGSVGGRYVAMTFVSSSRAGGVRAGLDAIRARRDLFDDGKATWFGVSADPTDQAQARVVDEIPGLRWFYDPGAAIARLYQAVDGKGKVDNQWLILDPSLRVLAGGPIAEVETMLRIIERLPSPSDHAGVPITAPVLLVPRVFEPEFCRMLVGLYETHGGQESGFMQEINGKTTLVLDNAHKRRADFTIEDEAIRNQCRARIVRRLLPEIEKSFQFRATRMERYIVACYEAEKGGHFRAHRDNTTKGTAHRRFAVTLNLNAEDYEGGELRFPEFGQRTYKPPTGGAVVFSCSLLHEATPVTRGQRYVFLPFLYDEAASKIREENLKYLDDNVPGARPGRDEPAPGASAAS